MRVFFSADTQWRHQWLLYDRDGSLTGEEAGSKVVPSSSLYNPEWCTESSRFSRKKPAMVCGPDAKFVLFGFHKFEPLESLFMQPIHIENQYGEEDLNFASASTIAREGWFMIIPTGIINKISYPTMPAVTDIYYMAKFLEMEVSL